MTKNRSRKDAMKLCEETIVLSNNWYYIDNGPQRYDGEHDTIINSWLMTQRNDKQFKEMFGKCTFANSNMFTEYTRCWVREFLDETFLLYSSERGSSYEIVTDMSWDEFHNNKKCGRVLIAFVEDLVAKMRKLESNQKNIAEWNKFGNER